MSDRYRAWRATFPSGKTMTVLAPEGMDHDAAMQAVSRWQGMTVTPVLSSRVDP